jgi:protein-histidine pros-kinase
MDQQNQIRLQVKDTGIGIKEEDLPRIFHDFVQLNIGTTKVQQGAGLGLALTKKILEQQKGSISAESEVGHGSTFTVVLPVASEPRVTNP